MAFTDEELLEITKNAGDNIKARISGLVEKGVIAEVESQLKYVISEQVQTYLKEEIVPEIKKILLIDKPVIIEAAAKAANEIGDALTKALVKQAVENLEKSWTRNAIMKGLFE